MSSIVNIPQDYKTVTPSRKFTNDGATELDNDFELSGDVWSQGGATYRLTGTVKEGTLPMSFSKGPYGGTIGTGIVSSSTVSPMSYLNQGGFIDLDEKVLPTKLNDKLWDEESHLKAKVKESLLKIANKFRDEIGLFIVEDIRVTGSLANYNYTKDSDIDLHLVYDFDNIGVNKDILQSLFNAKKQIFNNTYDISINGIPVEVGVEDINSPLISTGVYSLMKDSWVIEPDCAGEEVPDANQDNFQGLVQKVENAIESKDKNLLLSVFEEIKNMRKSSLKKGGEFAQGNLLFKELRNGGYIKRLKDALNTAISAELSIEEMFINKNKFPKTSIPTKSEIWSMQ